MRKNSNGDNKSAKKTTTAPTPTPVAAVIKPTVSSSPPLAPSASSLLSISPTKPVTTTSIQQNQHPQYHYRKIRPEPVNEKTLVESVVNFLHDKVPQAYTYGNKRPQQTQDIKEPIEWVHYEMINFNNKINFNIKSIVISNILLIIGYKTGFSIWCIDLNGVATEVLAIKETQITHVKLLKLDQTKLLLAICKYISEQHYQISIVSLTSGDICNKIDYNGEILEIKSNSRFLVISSINSIDAYDMLNNFEHKFKITTCYSTINNQNQINSNSNSPNGSSTSSSNSSINSAGMNSSNTKSSSSSLNHNPFALGSRWLAFADNKFHVMFNSQGGMSNEVEQSYTAAVLSTAKSITKGITKITETVVSSVVPKSSKTTGSLSTSNTPPSVNVSDSPRTAKKKSLEATNKDDYQSGICTIIDTHKYVNNSNETHDIHDENQQWIIAHFIAHLESIYAIEFNHNGRLLVTADLLGQYFNVYQINPNPYKCTRTNVKHLYSLYRGDTTSKVRDISFSSDSRWVAVSTKRGTTHIFAINSYGGSVNARTHSNPYVVNRASRHSRTAGFADEEQYSKYHQTTQQHVQHTHLLQQVQQQQHHNHHHQQTIVLNNPNTDSSYFNPKIKTLLEPFVIQALAQIRQPYGCGYTNTANSITDNALTSIGITNFFASPPNTNLEIVCVAALFADTRGYLSPEEPRDFAKSRLKPVNSLFVISNLNGNLIEYVLDVSVDMSKTGNKRTNDSPIMLKVTPKAQWPLQRSIAINELKYPLFNDNPLLNIYKKINNLIINENLLSNNNGYYSIGSYSSSPNLSCISNITSIGSNTNDRENESTKNNVNNEWIKLVEISTHLGPHRRLFMGPQFVFKTINSNVTTTALNAASSSIVSNETPLIDLSGDIELNSLDLTRNYSTSPMSIPADLTNGISCTPTYIEVGPGSFQDEMPVFSMYGSSNESQKSCNKDEATNEAIIETIADAMSELQVNNNSPNTAVSLLNNANTNQINLISTANSSYINNANNKITAAIAILNNSNTNPNNTYRRSFSMSKDSSIQYSNNNNSTTMQHSPNNITTSTNSNNNNNINKFNFNLIHQNGNNSTAIYSINNNDRHNMNNTGTFSVINNGLTINSNNQNNSTNNLIRQPHQYNQHQNSGSINDDDSTSSSTHSSVTSNTHAQSLENIPFQDDTN